MCQFARVLLSVWTITWQSLSTGELFAFIVKRVYSTTIAKAEWIKIIGRSGNAAVDDAYGFWFCGSATWTIGRRDCRSAATKVTARELDADTSGCGTKSTLSSLYGSDVAAAIGGAGWLSESGNQKPGVFGRGCVTARCLRMFYAAWNAELSAAGGVAILSMEKNNMSGNRNTRTQSVAGLSKIKQQQGVKQAATSFLKQTILVEQQRAFSGETLQATYGGHLTAVSQVRPASRR